LSITGHVYSRRKAWYFGLAFGEMSGAAAKAEQRKDQDLFLPNEPWCLAPVRVIDPRTQPGPSASSAKAPLRPRRPEGR
jgi:hypothetical protein